MCDEELLELASDFGDLTEVAQLTLRDEMKKRGLGEPADHSRNSLAPREIIRPNPALEAAETIASNQVEYSWKVIFRQTDSAEEAAQMRMELARANIECWVETTPHFSVYRVPVPADPRFGMYRVLVAADQVDQAAEVLSRPIPQDIANASTQEVPDYVIPCCPKCGTADPVLESADPQNTWRCESCDHRWTESEAVLTPNDAEKKP